MCDPLEHDLATRQQLRHQAVVEALTRSIGDGVWVVDVDGALLLLNPAAERLLGWTEAELLGVPMREVVRPRAAGTPSPTDHPLQGVPWLERGVTIDNDVFARKDGTNVAVSYTVSPILTNGRFAGSVVAFRDASERQQSEEAHRLLAAIVASSDDAIMTKDMDDRITTWNPGAERLYGYTAAEMIGQPSLRLVPPERADEMYRILERLQRGERVDHFETVRLRKDGSHVDVSVSVAPLADAAGRVVGASAIARDITERKRAEQELAARAHQQAAMATLRQQALTSADPSTLMDEAVALVARTLDVEYGAILELLPDRTTLRLRSGVGWAEGVVGQATVDMDSLAGFTMASSEPVIVADLRTETRFRGPPLLHEHGVVSGVSIIMGGHERPMGVLEAHTTRPRLFTADDVHFLRAVANLLATVSARKSAEEALSVSEHRYAQAQQIAAMEERARLARELHDSVTQMLFSASVIAEVLPRLWERDQADAHHSLDDLRLLTRGALAEMRTLLLELRPAALTEADLGDLLRQLAEAMTGRTRVPINLTVDGERSLPPDVQITLYRLAQESLNNVARHAGASAVTMSLHAGPGGVELRIADDGRGFDPASVGPGHLGLRILRERAATIGATLAIESAPGRGTRVVLRWTDSVRLEDP